MIEVMKAAAVKERAKAQAKYDRAKARKDTRAMSEAMYALRAATAKCLRWGV